MRIQNCKNCTYYSSYYKQWSDCYSRLNHGFCSKHEKPKIQNETCGNFKSGEQKEKRREERLFSSLERSLESINQIAQILKEKES